jgi:hypothetical protein
MNYRICFFGTLFHLKLLWLLLIIRALLLWTCEFLNLLEEWSDNPGIALCCLVHLIIIEINSLLLNFASQSTPLCLGLFPSIWTHLALLLSTVWIYDLRIFITNSFMSANVIQLEVQSTVKARNYNHVFLIKNFLSSSSKVLTRDNLSMTCALIIIFLHVSLDALVTKMGTT